MDWILKIYELDSWETGLKVLENDKESLAKISEAGDFLFEKIDDLLSEEKFEEVDELILQFDLNKLSSFILILLLSITLYYSSYLKNRKILFNKIREILLLKESDKSRVNELLKGLENANLYYRKMLYLS